MRRPDARLLLAAAALLLAGCGGGSEPPAPAASGSSSPAATGASEGVASGEPNPAADDVDVAVSVRDGKVIPKPRRVPVPVGSRVRLRVTSDTGDELHVHCFEIEKPLPAGQTITVTLTADQPGLCEVETHESELQLLQLEIR